MDILHIALGGCLKAPPIKYGVTEDTGGHIAYVIAAAQAQAASPDVRSVRIATRLFRDPGLDPVHGLRSEILSPKLRIVRLRGATDTYLSKEALAADLPALRRDLIEMVARHGAPDVVHAHFADAADLALALRARLGCRVVYTPHSLALDKQDLGAPAGARIARERRAIRESDAIVASTRDECERQVAAYCDDAAGRTYRVRPGGRFASGAGGTARARALIAPYLGAPDLPFLLAVARPVAKKNLGGLVSAYAATPGLRDAANLVIFAGQHGDVAADGESADVMRALRRDIRRHGLEGRVALPPAHGEADVAEIYRLAADCGGVFVNCALFEPFGLTTLEAAAAGLPVVVTDRGGPPELVAEIGHGLAVDPTDTEAIGAACLSLLTNRPLWQACAAAGRASASANAWQDWSDAVLGVYRARLDPPAHRLSDSILVSDIDGTLTGDADAAARFVAWRARSGMAFVAATGRSAPEARAVLARWRLPAPDILIASVGTEIYAGARADLDEDYARFIEHGWDAEAVHARLAAAGARPQAPVEQRRWKRSYLGDGGEADRLARCLRGAGLAARVVASHGTLIDVLPARAGKAAAMRWVARRLGLSNADCIACGDSGNDRDMIEAAGLAVVVGDPHGELHDLVGRAGIHRAERAHADGVLEGLERFAVDRAARPLEARS